MLDLLEEKESLWDYLRRSEKPVVLYGMGDGAGKVLTVLKDRDIPVSGVFASEGFVRGQSFQGFVVETLGQVEARLDDFIILLCFATQLPDVMEKIAFAAARHPLYAPDVPVCGGDIFDMDFVRTHEREMDAVYGLLADESPRRVFLDTVNYKLSGKLCYLQGSHTLRTDWYKLVHPGSEEIFIDAGAYTGDTVEEFISAVQGRYGRILALEPDQKNYRKLIANMERYGSSRIDCRNIGVWDREDILSFRQSSGRQNRLDGDGVPNMPVNSIDNLLAGEKATIIKYDVEGTEEQALLGSSETIAKYRPSLMISAYHHSWDLFALPLLAVSLYPGYKLYLRRPSYVPAWDLTYILTDKPGLE